MLFSLPFTHMFVSLAFSLFATPTHSYGRFSGSGVLFYVKRYPEGNVIPFFIAFSGESKLQALWFSLFGVQYRQNDKTLVFSTQHAPVGTRLCVVCMCLYVCVFFFVLQGGGIFERLPLSHGC